MNERERERRGGAVVINNRCSILVSCVYSDFLQSHVDPSVPVQL